MSNMIEMPGGPRLDHYYGRGITGIEENEDGWTILLSGDVRITHYTDDPESDYERPTNEMIGMQLVGAIFSETETRMLFKLGTERQQVISVSPTDYSISDPNVVGGESFPQRPPELTEEAPESDSDEAVDEGEESEQG